MVLVVVPSSPRNGSIVVAILTIVQFIFLIYSITTFEDFKETAFIYMVVVFSIICIISSICLMIGAIQLRHKLIIPYIMTMSLFVCSYAIVFVVMITSGNSRRKDWIHFSILGVNVCFLIAAGALYREIVKARHPEAIQATVAQGPVPGYGY